jgi:hypothetical protein
LPENRINTSQKRSAQLPVDPIAAGRSRPGPRKTHIRRLGNTRKDVIVRLNSVIPGASQRVSPRLDHRGNRPHPNVKLMLSVESHGTAYWPSPTRRLAGIRLNNRATCRILCQPLSARWHQKHLHLTPAQTSRLRPYTNPTGSAYPTRPSKPGSTHKSSRANGFFPTIAGYVEFTGTLVPFTYPRNISTHISKKGSTLTATPDICIAHCR